MKLIQYSKINQYNVSHLEAKEKKNHMIIINADKALDKISVMIKTQKNRYRREFPQFDRRASTKTYN